MSMVTGYSMWVESGRFLFSGPWVLILRAQKSSFRAGWLKKGARWLRAVCPSSSFLFAQSCTFCVVVTEEVQVSQTHTIFYLNWREQYYSEGKSLFCMWCNWNSGSKLHREPHSPSKVVSQLTLNWQKNNWTLHEIVDFSFWFGNINISNWSKWGGWWGIGMERSAEISPYLCWFFSI